MKDELTFEQACHVVESRLRDDDTVDSLDKRALLAIIQDRPDEASRLIASMARRNALGLAVIKGGKAVPPRSS